MWKFNYWLRYASWIYEYNIWGLIQFLSNNIESSIWYESGHNVNLNNVFESTIIITEIFLVEQGRMILLFFVENKPKLKEEEVMNRVKQS